MREIKFRGKSKLTGLFLEGNLLIDQDGETYIVWSNCHKKECWTSVYPHTIGQYTGLKDKNGVKIFEGDILEQESFFGYPILHVVGWSEENALFTAKLMQDDFPTSRIAQYWVSKKSVVGNIHDNPELLEGGGE